MLGRRRRGGLGGRSRAWVIGRGGAVFSAHWGGNAKRGFSELGAFFSDGESLGIFF